MHSASRHWGNLVFLGSMVWVLFPASTACSGKKRDFASGPIQGPPSDGGRSEAATVPAIEPGRDSNDSNAIPMSATATVGSGCEADGDCDCGVEGGDCTPIPACDPGDSGLCVVCMGCLIDSVCFAGGAANPRNGCQECDLNRSSSVWSSRDGACDDDQFCTTNDSCVDGACVGTARACEDGVDCNGVSECDEDANACTTDVNQCGDNEVCDAVSGSCVSTCAGCVVNGTCIEAGVERIDNSCFVCDPARSISTFSPVAGKLCGSGPGVCSGQDTCDAQGVCQPNHFASGVGCGNPTGNACDQPDTCNGNGFCEQRLAANGAACGDGQFCTVGDECQGGACVSNALRNCGAGRTCDEGADQCRCSGCEVGGNCLAAGTVNSANPCQICDPGRSTTAFSPVQCSAGRVCDASGRCTCPPGQTEVGGSCGIPDGQPCTNPALCFSGGCTRMFRDRDGDTFGDSTTDQTVCGPLQSGFVTRGGDCCDNATNLMAAARVSPGQTTFFPDPSPVCGVGYDYNCDDAEELRYPGLGNCSGDTDAAACQRSEGFDVFPPPSCGAEGLLTQCDFISSCSTSARFPDVQTCR